MRVIEYTDADGKSPFGAWFSVLDPYAAAKVTVALTRMELGNLSNVKAVGGGVLEYRIDWGPGYRIYFGRYGNKWIVLLAGGTKRRQQQDIAQAFGLWQDYKRRTRER